MLCADPQVLIGSSQDAGIETPATRNRCSSTHDSAGHEAQSDAGPRPGPAAVGAGAQLSGGVDIAELGEEIWRGDRLVTRRGAGAPQSARSIKGPDPMLKILCSDRPSIYCRTLVAALRRRTP
jgi:hypothetical protein